MTTIGELALVFVASALVSVVLIWLLQPLLKRHALAHPNVRSSHKTPTPQGGGIAVIAATVGVVVACVLFGVAQPRRTGPLARVGSHGFHRPCGCNR